MRCDRAAIQAVRGTARASCVSSPVGCDRTPLLAQAPAGVADPHCPSLARHQQLHRHHCFTKAARDRLARSIPPLHSPFPSRPVAASTQAARTATKRAAPAHHRRLRGALPHRPCGTISTLVHVPPDGQESAARAHLLHLASPRSRSAPARGTLQLRRASHTCPRALAGLATWRLTRQPPLQVNVYLLDKKFRETEVPTRVLKKTLSKRKTFANLFRTDSPHAKKTPSPKSPDTPAENVKRRGLSRLFIELVGGMSFFPLPKIANLAANDFLKNPTLMIAVYLECAATRSRGRNGDRGRNRNRRSRPPSTSSALP